MPIDILSLTTRDFIAATAAEPLARSDRSTKTVPTLFATGPMMGQPATGEGTPPGVEKGNEAPPIAAADNAAPKETPATAPAAEPLVKIAYKKDATKAGAAAVDAIIVTARDMAQHQKEMMKYIGDEQIRLLVAAPTDKMAAKATTHSGRFRMATATRSPFWIP